MSKHRRTFALVIGCSIGLAGSVLGAGQNITGITTTTTPGTASTVDGLNYDNTTQAVTSFADALGANYSVISSADYTAAQRNGTPNQSSAWYYLNGASGNLAGVSQTSYPALLASNNLLQGADNVFVNGTAASSGNIERLDYSWATPLSNDSQLAFAVFDRGLAGAHDAFTIAIISAISPTTGAPTAYAGYLKIAAGWGGASNPLADQRYQLLRYSAGDALTSLTNRTTLTADQNTQGVAGIVIRASEFNLPAGTTIYGYSLMGSDVNPATNADLLDVTNTAVYPAGTDSSGGGIDLVSLNGIAFRGTVPEPSTLAAAGVGLGLAATMLARRRRRYGRPACVWGRTPSV